MRKLLGFTLIAIAIGLTIGLFIKSIACQVVIICMCLILGFNLFNC